MMVPEIRMALRLPLAPSVPQTLSREVLAPSLVMELSSIPSEMRANSPPTMLSTTNPAISPSPTPTPVPNPRLKPPFSAWGGASGRMEDPEGGA